jgi:endoglycosylceramidase
VPQKLTPFAVDSNGMPTPSSLCDSIDWSLSYLTVATCNAFGRLYNNYDNLGDALAAYWKVLAQQYANTTNILGYDLLNEPWVGDSYSDPTLLTPGVADHVNLEPLWNKVATQIRTVDSNNLIFFEGTTYDILSGFNNVPLGDGSRTVQSFHYYNPPQLGTIEDTIKNRIQDNIRLHTASILTEHTMWMGDSTQMSNIQSAVDTADQYMMSWMGWAYENLYNTTTDQPYPEIAGFYSRAYPAAVAGNPTSFFFNSTDSSFNLAYTISKNVTAPTEIVLPLSTYPNGYVVSTKPADSLSQYTKDNMTLSLFTADNVTDGQAVSVRITKK